MVAATNPHHEWTRLTDIATNSKRSLSLVMQYARQLKLDVHARRELRSKGRGGRAPLAIPTKDAAPLIALLDGVQRRNGSNGHSNGANGKTAPVLTADEAQAEALFATAGAANDAARMRAHCRALVLLCKKLDAEIQIDKDGYEITRPTTERVKIADGGDEVRVRD